VIGEVDMEEEESVFKVVFDAIDNLSAQAGVGDRGEAHRLHRPFRVQLGRIREMDSVACSHRCLLSR